MSKFPKYTVDILLSEHVVDTLKQHYGVKILSKQRVEALAHMGVLEQVERLTKPPLLTRDPFDAMGHVIAARQLWPQVGVGPISRALSDLESSISGWWDGLPALMAFIKARIPHKIRLATYVHTAGTPGGSFTQSGSLMVDWVPYVEVRSRDGSSQLTALDCVKPHDMGGRVPAETNGKRMNRLLEITRFDEICRTATKKEDRLEQRVAAHVVAGVAVHVEAVRNVLGQLVDNLEVTQTFDVVSEKALHFDSNPGSPARLAAFRITSVNWHEPRLLDA